MSKVLVGVGSNLGDREFLIRKAVEAMRDLPRTLVVRVSSLYDTDPVGVEDQPAFLNAVVWLETTLEPRELLWQLLLIEKRMGRVRSQRWGPRPIDLDLLFYDDRTIAEPDLTVPHPEAHRRAFVLMPLLELDPEFVHPATGETIKKLVKRLPPNPPVRKGGRFWY
ncbi:MAG TPA: 2-amino-4-hydroxy-6-hydroxymethyldihydropteridine diphosphokinase [Candidatus Angelobacter sp.]|nr:2-amino-4-hydroxy-6-hydroxymethyldihydropteridine diphosphokinase [Candidatus Angelobacter sp.]